MSLQQNSAAVAAARAHVEAWSKCDYEAARAALADDVWVTVIAADPSFPKTDLKGVDAYMQGLIQFAEAGAALRERPRQVRAGCARDGRPGSEDVRVRRGGQDQDRARSLLPQLEQDRWSSGAGNGHGSAARAIDRTTRETIDFD
jgi:hypothetical protein